MEKREINARLAVARKTIYSNNALPHHYEAALRNLRYINQFLEDTDLRAHELMAKLYYVLGRYSESREEYDHMLSIDNNNLRAIMGLYKISVLEGNMEEALAYLRKYYDLNKEKDNFVDISVIETLINYLLGSDLEFREYPSKYIAYDLDTNEELKDKFCNLFDAIKINDFKEAIRLARECDGIARKNGLFVEFYVLEGLLQEVECVYRTRLQDEIKKRYIQLGAAVYNHDVDKILELLNFLKNYFIQDEQTVVKALFILVSNNYLDDAVDVIEAFTFSKGSKEKLKILKRIINEKLFITTLSDEQVSVYDEAIKRGHDLYQSGDNVGAYDVYSWGSYVTAAPIFLYYIGKMLYKMNRFREARDYLLEYIEVGGLKIDKACLYLAKIYEKYGKKKEAVKYANRVNLYNMILGTDFPVFESPFQEEYDARKARAQRKNRINESFFDNEYTARVQEFRDLFSKGSIEQAEAMIAELEQKEDKTKEDRIVLSIVRKNKTLYVNNRISG